MTNHELLDLLGEVNEDYVLEADGKVSRPRLGWKKLAACAACAVMVLGAYPVYRLSRNQNLDLPGLHPLHGYTVVEGGGMDGPQALVEGGGTGTPVPNTPEANTEPAQIGAGQSYDVSGQRKAIAQYQGLLKGMGGQGGCAPEPYPDWYGGAWIDDTGDKLAVAIVDGFHTGELEAQIKEWCGGEVVFVQDMKYSYAHLLDLSEQILQALQEHLNQDDAWSALTSIVPDMMSNYLAVGFSGTPSDAALAFLARLDPDGDAIRVQAYADKPNTLTGEGPAPAPVDPENRAAPAVEPAPGGTVYHGEDAPADAVPGGAQPQDRAQTCGEPEEGRPAHYDLLPPDE